MPTTNPAITGTLAAGQIPYTNLVHRSGPDVVLGSNNLWWAAAEARLGVGTNGAVPSAKAHVVGDGAPAARPLALRVDGTGAARGEVFFGDISLSTYSTDEVVFEICTPARAAARSRGFRYAGGAQTNVSGGELNDVTIAPASVEFGTGTTLAQQSGIYVPSPTYSATSAKTITTASTLRTVAPTKGTSVSWGQISVGLAFAVFGLRCVSGGGFRVEISGVDGFAPSPAFAFSTAITGVAGSTEYNAIAGGRAVGTTSVTWSSAPSTTQRWIYIQAPVYGATGGTFAIDTAATVTVEKGPTATTGISITNSYALWSPGKVRLAETLIDGTFSTDRLTATGDVTFTIPAGDATAFSLKGASGRIFTIDTTTNYVGIGYTTVAPPRPISLLTAAAANTLAGVRNESTSGLSAFACDDDGGTSRLFIGYANSGYTGDSVLANRSFIALVNTTDFVIRNTALAATLFLQDSTRRWAFNTTTTASDDVLIAQVTQTTGSPTAFRVTGAAHTTLSNAEASDVVFGLARTVQFGQNTLLATQRAVAITAPTYSSSAATKTITDAVTLDITAAPTAGTNVAITNPYALRVQAGETRLLGGLRVTGNEGHFGAAAVGQQTVGAITNNVTSGGTTGTIADFTDLTVYANDAAAIRNNIYQLARIEEQLTAALRNLGFGA